MRDALIVVIDLCEFLFILQFRFKDNFVHLIYMEEPQSRPLRIEDFLETNTKNTKNNKHHSYDDTIAKNQQEFGHRKRIKP